MGRNGDTDKQQCEFLEGEKERERESRRQFRLSHAPNISSTVDRITNHSLLAPKPQRNYTDANFPLLVLFMVWNTHRRAEALLIWWRVHVAWKWDDLRVRYGRIFRE